MFRRILYPYDFSDVSRKAVDYIKKLREAGTEEVIVLHVVDSRACRALFYDTNRSLKAETELFRKASTDIRPVVEELQAGGFIVRVRIETAIPSQEILRVEEEENPSLIVMGSHGKSNIEEMLLGSVSEAVVRKASGPVLVIKR